MLKNEDVNIIDLGKAIILIKTSRYMGKSLITSI
jgi:hypothetical protein